jgi:hypothetical protein
MEKDELFGDEMKLGKEARYQTVPENLLSLSPYNCIGRIGLVGMGNRPAHATGFLISDSLVLTSAHIFFQNYKGVNKKFTPYEFCLNMHKNYNSN